jgi:prepilin-type N-terminal cleavage/methylation domain-containing protein/prepilin-type processing-associated H-X9-DG protein
MKKPCIQDGIWKTVHPIRKGFTLVELLVVIAIIALLMSILLPALQRVKKQAKAVACQSNLHQWGVAFQLFAHDNEGYFPPSVGGQEAYWLVAMLPYIGATKDETSKAHELFLCPMASKSLNPIPCNRCLGTTFTAWGPFDPGSAGDWWYTGAMGSYGLNEWCANPPAEYDSYWGFPSQYAWRTPDVKGGGNIPILLDCLYVDAFPLVFDTPPAYPEVVHESGDWGINAMQLFCIDRHNGGINGLFTDWSARKIGLKELWRLKWHNAFDTAAPAPNWREEAPWMVKFSDY